MAASAASSPSAGEVGDGKSVGTGMSSSAGDEATPADFSKSLALGSGAVGGGNSVFCSSPEVLLGELGGGTSVGTGISVGEGRAGAWGEVGTGTSVGTGEPDFRLPSESARGDVDAGTSVGTGISVGERTASGRLFFAFPEPGMESGVSDASFWGDADDAGRSVGAGISGGVTDSSF